MPVQRSELERRDDAITQYYDSIFWLFFENPDKAYLREEIEDRVSLPNWIIRLRLWPIRTKGSGRINQMPIDVITVGGEEYYMMGDIDIIDGWWGILGALVFLIFIHFRS